MAQAEQHSPVEVERQELPLTHSMIDGIIIVDDVSIAEDRNV